MREEKLVAALSEIMAKKCGIYPDIAERLRTAAALHDIGKLLIDKNILNKPGKLTEQEFEIMKKHTTLGAELLTDIQGEIGEMARNVCLLHHEWYNPSMGGYWGVPSDSLPEYVCIVSICDVAVALLSKRVYKEPWTAAEVIEYIRNQSGTQFNPMIAGIFINLMRHDENAKILFEKHNIELCG